LGFHDPIWRAYFSTGLVQPPNIIYHFQISPLIFGTFSRSSSWSGSSAPLTPLSLGREWSSPRRMVGVSNHPKEGWGQMTSLMTAYPKPISGHFTDWFPNFSLTQTRDRHKRLTGWQHHRRGTVRFHTVLLENFLANRRRNPWKLVGYFERLSRMGFLSSIGGGCLELHVCIYLPTVGCCTDMY